MLIYTSLQTCAIIFENFIKKSIQVFPTLSVTNDRDQRFRKDEKLVTFKLCSSASDLKQIFRMSTQNVGYFKLNKPFCEGWTQSFGALTNKKTYSSF